MGLDKNGSQCILFARKAGVDFRRTACIGRQSLHLSKAQLKKNLKKFGFPCSKESLNKIFIAAAGFSEELFRFLGAEQVDSFDYSEYEGATYCHDMNKQIPPQYKGLYSVVLDSGTLEHVFNFPIAIKNCMEMVRTGGYYIGITPANNFMGHGFYQFSPELFFNVFTESQGFTVSHMIIFEDRSNPAWYCVNSPDSVKARVTLRNSRPAYLFIIAKKISSVEPFDTEPQQSDYVAAWTRETGAESKPGEKRSRTMSVILRNTPKPIKVGLRKVLGIDKPIERFDYFGFNPLLYKKINPADPGNFH